MDGTLKTAVQVDADEAISLLRHATDASEEGFLLYDAELRVIMHNPALERIMFVRVPPPRPGDRMRDIARDLFSCGWLVTPPGTDFEAAADAMEQQVLTSIRNLQLHLANGRIVIANSTQTTQGGYLISVRDVTDGIARREAERREREAHALLRAVLDASPVPLTVTDMTTGAEIYASSARRNVFAEAMVDGTIDPETRECCFLALRERGSVEDQLLEVTDRDGRARELLVSARSLLHGGGRVAVCAFRDVTETRAMERALARQREIDHQTEKLSALGELLTTVSHELSNPLSIVSANVTMLRDLQTDPATQRRIARTASAAERCVRIVRTFLAMARAKPAMIASTSVSELVDAVLDVLGGGIEDRGAEVRVAVPVDLPSVAADADRLQQVLANLFVNADQAIAERGPEGLIEISAHLLPCGNEVELTVADNGPGVPEELRNRIFEPFVTSKASGSGTGVGLAFAHKTMSEHGGSLRLRDGSPGATFEIRLPVYPPGEQP